MFKKILSLSLTGTSFPKFLTVFGIIALMLFSFVANASAININNRVVVDVGTNGWAKSSIEIWDQNGGYKDDASAPAARKNYQKVFFIPDNVKWHNLEVKFNHGVVGQGPSDYVVIPHYTGGVVNLYFETYGDDVEGHYNGLHKYWNDKHENHFWLG